MSIRETVSHDGNVTLSSLTFVGSVEANGKTLSCRAENVAMKSKPLEEKMILDVHCKCARHNPDVSSKVST